jgi:hypothetical protein
VRQDVQQEAAQELGGRERAGALAAGAKGDLCVTDRDHAGGTDGHTVRVAAEVVDDLRRAAEGLLQEYDERLYRALDRLLPHKEKIEQYLVKRLGELFLDQVRSAALRRDQHVLRRGG